MHHADHDDVIGVGVTARMVEIHRDEGEKWSSREKIDDATQSAAMMTGVAPMRAALVWVCAM
jgi:hypothetical protein